jgi:hypothetical protein
VSKVSTLEPWLTLAELAAHLKVSERWLKYRIKEGMPSALIGNRRKFRASETERWLEKEGHLVRSA